MSRLWGCSRVTTKARKKDSGCVEGVEMDCRGIAEARLNKPRMTLALWPGDKEAEPDGWGA